MKDLTFKPGSDIVAIEHVSAPTTTASGIIMETSSTQKYPAKGKVIALGPNMSIDLKIGDMVLYNMAIEEGVCLDGITFDLALSQNILGSFPK